MSQESRMIYLDVAFIRAQGKPILSIDYFLC